jgi:hypothetical protein
MNISERKERDRGENIESLEKKAVANYLEGLHRETRNQGVRSIT